MYDGIMPGVFVARLLTGCSTGRRKQTWAMTMRPDWELIHLLEDHVGASSLMPSC